MKKTALLMTLLLASVAHAHSGQGAHTHDLVSGMLHPVGGWDHLLAMLALGVWSAQQQHARSWTIPLGFASVLALGLLVGAAGLVQVPFELGIAASVLVLGLLVAGAVRLPLPAAYAIAGGAALFHGLAHGAEIPATASLISFGAGMLLSTLALHFSAWYATRLTRRALLWRAAGAAVGVAGMAALVV